MSKNGHSQCRHQTGSTSSITWSPPGGLTYDDGSPVHVPASLARFLTDPRTGRIFWFGNILDHPVHGCDPRYPLTMAEFDPETLSIVKESVTIIQDLPDGALRSEDGPNGHGRRTAISGTTSIETPANSSFSCLKRPTPPGTTAPRTASDIA